MFKVSNRNTRKRCEISSTLTINTPDRRHWRRSGIFIANFEHISHLFLVFLLLMLTGEFVILNKSREQHHPKFKLCLRLKYLIPESILAISLFYQISNISKEKRKYPTSGSVKTHMEILIYQKYRKEWLSTYSVNFPQSNYVSSLEQELTAKLVLKQMFWSVFVFFINLKLPVKLQYWSTFLVNTLSCLIVGGSNLKGGRESFQFHTRWGVFLGYH